GITREFTFDQRDELSRYVVRDDTNAIRQERFYTHDGNGDLVREVSANGVVADFAYDACRQLLYVRGSGVTAESFVYDGDENILRYKDGTEFIYRGDRLAEAGDILYEYDGAGRVVRRVEGTKEYRFE